MRKTPPEVDARPVIENKSDVTSGRQIVTFAEVDGLVDDIVDDLAVSVLPLLVVLLLRPVVALELNRLA